VQEDIGETSQERVTAAIQGLLVHAYMALVTDSDDSYQNLKNLADRVYKNYDAKTAGFNGPNRIPLRPYPDMVKEVVGSLLDPQRGLPPEARAILRTRLGLPAETAAPAPGLSPSNATNSPSGTVTNAPVQ
jgi:hypothetical protein